MKDKFMQFIKNHRAAIGWTLYIGGCAVATLYGCSMIYNTAYRNGSTDGVNKLLFDGSLKWSDGMPVILNGELISGDPDWKIPLGDSPIKGRWYKV
jgi:hypothetical protein